MAFTQRVINALFFGKLLVLGVFLPVFLLENLLESSLFPNKEMFVMGAIALFLFGVAYGFKNNEKITHIPQKYFMVLFLPVLLLLATKLYQIAT